MDARDSLIWEWLRNTSQLNAQQVQALIHCWQTQRRGPEGLAEFLTRRQVLNSRTLRFLAAGHAAYGGTNHLTELFDDETITRLHDLIEPLVHTTVVSGREVQDKAWALGLQSTQSAAVPLQLPPIGTRIGSYLLISQSGSGSSSVVYRAVHMQLQRVVAIKVMHPQLIEAHPDLRLHFWAEARLLAQLNHPNIVRVIDCAEQDGLPYLVMEYVEGFTLRELIEQSGRLVWDRVVTIALQIAQALTATERLGIVHRDVKPSNILITRDGTAKLADVGLACAVRNANADAAPDANGTPPGEFTPIGTVSYMSPEQVLGNCRLDTRADIYSLGVTCYQMLTGRLPYQGHSQHDILQAHLHAHPVPPHQLVADIPMMLSALVMQMMAKIPDHRVNSASELVEPLQSLLANR
jgi:serine/threonine protein kinase